MSVSDCTLDVLLDHLRDLLPTILARTADRLEPYWVPYEVMGKIFLVWQDCGTLSEREMQNMIVKESCNVLLLHYVFCCFSAQCVCNKVDNWSYVLKTVNSWKLVDGWTAVVLCQLNGLLYVRV